MFANAFAPDAVYELAADAPVFGYTKLRYDGRDDIRTIITDRLERSRTTDPATLSYDPASLRRYNRNSDESPIVISYLHVFCALQARAQIAPAENVETAF